MKLLVKLQGMAESASDKRVQALEREIETLKSENNALISMQEATGEISIPMKFYTFVENNLDLKFTSHPKTIKTDDDKLLEAAEYRWLYYFKQAGLDNRQYAFELIRLLPENTQNYDLELAALEINPAAGKIGVYDVQAKELMLSKNFQIDDIDHSTDLIRLLTIALLELHYPAKTNLTDDAFVTRDAIIRGRASMVAHRFRNINTREVTHIEKPFEYSDSTTHLAKTLTQFTDQIGRAYIEQILQEQSEVFPELYEYIPAQSSYIFLKTPFNKQRVKPITPPIIPGQRTLIHTELGQIFTQALISRISGQHDELHLDLAYDTFTFSQSLEDLNVPILDWKITWISEDSAKTFTEIFNQNNQYSVATQQGNTVSISLL